MAEKDEAGVEGPDSVPPEVWRDTERWLDEWTQRVEGTGGAGARADRAAAPGPATGEYPVIDQHGPIDPPHEGEPGVPGHPAEATEHRLDGDSVGVGVRGGRDAGGTASDEDWAAVWARPSGYAPPKSPAYKPGSQPNTPPQRRPAPARSEPRPDESAMPPDAGLRTVPLSRSRLRLWRLGLAAFVAAVLAAVAVGLVAITDDEEPAVVALGEVTSADEGATLGTGERSAPLEPGAEVEAGDVVVAPVGGSVALDLPGGGVVRFDSGAEVTFSDEAVDLATGERDGESRPVLHLITGRAWLNPADGAPVELVLPGGRIATEANPVAVECSGDCVIQAPAAGVGIDSDGGGDAAPVPSEVVTLRSDGSMALELANPTSAWAEQNLEADRDAGLDDPEPGDEPGVAAAAILDGPYPLVIDVTGAPTGDALPAALIYGAGESYALQMQADASACPQRACEVPITAAGGATGTAEVADGSFDLSFSQPINCYDESRDNVVVPDIGTTTVTATLDVTSVAQDGTTWRVTAATGSGTVSTTLTKACNAGDVLGTSSSATSVTAG